MSDIVSQSSYQSLINKITKVISILLITSFVIKMYYEIRLLCVINRNFAINTWGYTEYLVNFEGGFVRRGLIGQLLYEFTKITGIYPTITISIICYAALAFVIIFFFKKFHDLKYCWWILLSPILLNYPCEFIRKDFLLYTILIGMYTLLKETNPSTIRRLAVTGIGILGIFVHEAFFFIFFPIVAIIFWADQKHRIVNSLLLLIIVLVFLIMCLYKGNINHSYAIIDSWNSILPGSPLYYEHNNTIGSIGWDSINTFIYHIKLNTAYELGGIGLVIRPIEILLSYYLITNFLFVFNKDRHLNDKSHSIVSGLYILAIIGIIPLLTVLSCDYARIIQYASISSIGAFIIIPQHILEYSLGRHFLCFVSKINSIINRLLPPTKGLMCLLLLFLAFSPWRFSLYDAFDQSVIGTVSKATISILHNLYLLF